MFLLITFSMVGMIIPKLAWLILLNWKDSKKSTSNAWTHYFPSVKLPKGSFIFRSNLPPLSILNTSKFAKNLNYSPLAQISGKSNGCTYWLVIHECLGSYTWTENINFIEHLKHITYTTKVKSCECWWINTSDFAST